MPKETPIIMSGDHPVKCLDGTKTVTRRTWGLKEINKEPDRWNLEWFNPRTGIAKFAMMKRAEVEYGDIYFEPIGLTVKCPYGGVGDRLWMKETHSFVSDPFASTPYVYYKADSSTKKLESLPEGAAVYNYIHHPESVKWRSSMFMHRWASRGLFEILPGLRPERLQEITEEDAEAEGVNGYLVVRFKYGEFYRVFRPYHRGSHPIIDHADIGDIIQFKGPNLGFACFTSKNPLCSTGSLRFEQRESFDYVGDVVPDDRNGYRIVWDSLNAKRGYGWEVNCWVWVITFKKLEGR